MAFRQHPAAHGGGCNDVRFSPSGVWAASCGQDGCVKLWTTQDGGLSSDIQRAQATSASVNCVAFCEEKGLLMGASNDRGIKVWDMHTARPRFTMTGARHRSQPIALCESSRAAPPLGLPQALRPCVDVRAGHDKAVTSVAQHPTSPNTAASCGEDRVIKLWSLNTGLCQRSIPCKSKPLCVAFSRDGNYLVSAHYDGSLRAYDAGSGTEAAHMQSLHTRSCVAVVPTAQPFAMVSVGRDDLVCVSDIFDVKVRLLWWWCSARLSLLCASVRLRVSSCAMHRACGVSTAGRCSGAEACCVCSGRRASSSTQTSCTSARAAARPPRRRTTR